MTGGGLCCRAGVESLNAKLWLQEESGKEEIPSGTACSKALYVMRPDSED